MGTARHGAGDDKTEIPEAFVRLLSTPEARRKPEDVFEIGNGLSRASFVQQLDFRTRSNIARCANLFDIVPGALITLCEKGKNALYIVLSGSVKVEAAGLEFQAGDTFGFRPPSSPTFQVMVDHRVATCAKRGVAAQVAFSDCVKVWSPELAKSILLRGSAKDEEMPIALEFLNFPPVNGYSKELREILVSQFVMLRGVKGGAFRTWINHLPMDPGDVRLSRVQLDSVIIVISGSLVATCRRRGDYAEDISSGIGASTEIMAGYGTGATEKHQRTTTNTGAERFDCIRGDRKTGCDQFVLMRLEAGGVFPPQSGQIQGGRHRKDEGGFDQETEQEWADFTLCSLIVESQSAEVLMVDASIFNDVIYPGTDLRYDMEQARDILSTPPGLRTSKGIAYIARNVLSHHVAFQQMSVLAVERVASRLPGIVATPAGKVLVEHGQRVNFFLLLLRGSASIIAVSKTRSRSQARRMKVGRLEPGDLWGMQHMQAGREAGVEIMAVENCEVIRGWNEEVRSAEKRCPNERPMGLRAARSLNVPPEKRTRRDVRNIVAEMSVPKSSLDITRLRHIPLCLKTRIAAALKLESSTTAVIIHGLGHQVWPPFRELTQDINTSGTYITIVKGSISLQTVPKSKRFHLETLDIPEKGLLKTLDVDNAVALEDWRASGLGPCAGMLLERQVMGEYPHPEEVAPTVRAVTREETTAVSVDVELYEGQLSRVGPTDKHTVVCHEVLRQLKRDRESHQTSFGSLESDLLHRLLGTNPVLKKLNTTCLLRLSGALALVRYAPGEVVTEADDYDNKLFIILEGRLEYFVQDIVRGVIDRALAKEAGMAPGLRCVGVMTSGDFFAPDSLMGRGGRRGYIVQAGTYLIRCSPKGSPEGAMCLVLPRKKLNDAVQRDRLANSALSHQRNLGGQSTLTLESSTLPTVSFGGPEPSEDYRLSTAGNADKSWKKGTGEVTSTARSQSQRAEDTSVPGGLRTCEPGAPLTRPAMTAPNQTTFKHVDPDRYEVKSFYDVGVRMSSAPGDMLQHSISPEVESLSMPSPLPQSVVARDVCWSRGWYDSEAVSETGDAIGAVSAAFGYLTDATKTGQQETFVTAVPSAPAVSGQDVSVGGVCSSSSVTVCTSIGVEDSHRNVKDLVGGQSGCVVMEPDVDCIVTSGGAFFEAARSSTADVQNSPGVAQKSVGIGTSNAPLNTLDSSRGWKGKASSSNGSGGRLRSNLSRFDEKQWPSVVVGNGVADMESCRLRDGAGAGGGGGSPLDALRSFISTRRVHLLKDHLIKQRMQEPADFPADQPLNYRGKTPHFSQASSRQDWKKGVVATSLHPTPLCCHQNLPPLTMGEVILAGTTLASVKQAIVQVGREARAAIVRSLAANAAKDFTRHSNKRSPRSDNREGCSIQTCRRTAALTKATKKYPATAVASRNEEPCSLRSRTRQQRSARRPPGGDQRVNSEGERRRPPGRQLHQPREHFHQCDGDGSTRENATELVRLDHGIEPEKPPIRQCFKCPKTPPRKNAGDGSRGETTAAAVDPLLSERVDQDCGGGQSRGERHFRVKLADDGAVAVRYGENGARRRQVGAAGGAVGRGENSRWRPQPSPPSHLHRGLQASKPTCLAVADGPLIVRNRCFSFAVAGDISSSRGSPESRGREGDVLTDFGRLGKGGHHGATAMIATPTAKVQRDREESTGADDAADGGGGGGSVAVIRINGCPPKQPAVVRRLKMALQNLNSLC